MEITVAKFGGSLLTDVDSVKRVSKFIESIRSCYTNLVVVVSALKHTTDLLHKQASQVSKAMSDEQLDRLLVTGEMISSTLVAMGVQDGVPMNAYDAGIYASGEYGEGCIERVDVDTILNVLEKGCVPVVCGFQGVSPAGGLMTLGRGGSDLTAMALGVWLRASVVIMYKDVPGVLKYPGAKEPLRSLEYDDLLNLQAAFERPLIQPKALEYAKAHGLSFVIQNPYIESTGTLCGSLVSLMPSLSN